MRIFTKKGETTSGLWNSVFQFVIPIVAFIAVLALVYSVGSDRTVHQYFQTSEIASIMTTMAEFPGEVRVLYAPIKDDFYFKVSHEAIETGIKGDVKTIARKVFIPQETKITDSLSDKKNIPVRQVEFFAKQGSLEITGYPFSDLNPTRLSYGFGRYDCPSISIVDSKSNVFFDNLDSQSLIAKQEFAKDISSNDVEKSLFKLNLNVINGNSNSILIFTDNTFESNSFACSIANKFSSLQLRNSDNFIVTIVPYEYNQHAALLIEEFNSKKTHQILIKVTINDKVNTETSKSGYYRTIFSKISDAYKAVTVIS